MEAAGKVVEYQQNHKSKENHHGRCPRGDTFREPKRNERSNEAYKSRQLLRKKDYRDARMERDSQMTCYNCRKLGHIPKNCPEKAFLIKEFHVDNMCCKGEVNRKFVCNIQIDTGACRTVVREDLVSRLTWKDSIVKLRIADNTEVTCPVADVIIKTGNNTYQIEAAIVRQLPADVLLGRDVLLGKGVPLLEYSLERMETEEIKQTLQRMLQKGVLNPEAIIAEGSEKYVLAVETRAQKIKRLEEEVQTRNWENESGGKPSSFRTSDIEDVQPAMSESSVISSEKSEEIDEEAAIDTQESEESAITEEDEKNPFDSFSEELFERVDPVVRNYLRLRRDIRV